jgi:hypothetical protein
MTQLDEFSKAYLRLTLEINKHIDGYVDAYYGPAEIQAEATAAEKKSPEALLADLDHLYEHLPMSNRQRREYLSAVLRGMNCTIRTLGGETFDYLDEAYRVYDIEPVMIDEARFTAAKSELETLLPGTGSITERLEAWRKPFEIPLDKLMSIIDLCLTECRRRTAALVDLIPGESVEFRLVSDQPWSGYNWYKANAHSLVEINTDLPVNALDILNLMAHEAYPGHHTEHHLKEKRLYQECGHGEVSSQLLHSPAAVIAEGIATTALEIIFPNDSAHQWIASELLPAAGLPPADPAQLARMAAAKESLRWVTSNAAILYHTGQLDQEQTLDYYRTYLLASEERCKRAFGFMSHPMYRTYIFTYTEGHKLIAEGARGGDKTPLFKRLLTEEVLPSRIPTLM